MAQNEEEDSKKTQNLQPQWSERLAGWKDYHHQLNIYNGLTDNGFIWIVYKDSSKSVRKRQKKKALEKMGKVKNGKSCKKKSKWLAHM